MVRGYLFFVGTVFATLLLFFLLGDARGSSLLTDPTPQLRRADVPAALLGVGLLLADSLLPVPSSLVMIAHGAAFGLALGTLLSLLGSVGATLIGFALGRRGAPLLARLVPTEERSTADGLLARHGTLAIVVTRPVPLLAETVAILAGASSLGWRKATFATLVGSLPAALIYALAGASVAGLSRSTLVFAAVVAAAAFAWLAERRMARGCRGAHARRLVKSATGISA